MSDPFLITGPAVISLSGGRTSGYMLWRILQAHGAKLPPDVLVCFCNTGREMPATLDFVRDIQATWSADVRWLEYRHDGSRPFCVEVNHNSASRDGEPFSQLIRARKMLPNPVTRFCTIEMKIRTIRRFIKDHYGWKRWTSVIGLRADESRRVEKSKARSLLRKDPFDTVCPLADAGIEEMDVLRFWRAQPFDLRLAGSWEGNCDGCFLKARGRIARMCRDHPERMEWWADQEATAPGLAIMRNPNMALFRADRETYAEMLRLAVDQPRLAIDEPDKSIPCDEAWCGA